MGFRVWRSFPFYQDGSGIIIEEYNGEREVIDSYSYNEQDATDRESLLLAFSSLVCLENEETV